MHRKLTFVAALVGALLVGSGVAFLAVLAAPDAAAPCRYGAPKKVGRLRDDRIEECSGLAASRRTPGVFWVHNDSGDAPRLFAIDREGRTRAVLSIRGAQARDWEDLAAGPGPDGSPSLFIGDTGNNSLNRTDLAVYRVREPDLPGGPEEMQSESAVAYPFRYPDGSHDCEALMVHPRTGVPYLVAKDTTGKPKVYRFPMPLQAGRQATLERVGSIRLEEPNVMGRMITAADIAPDGTRLVLRSYLTILEFRVPKGQPFEDALRQRPKLLRGPAELQGEAICYLPGGHGFLTIPEGEGAPIDLIACTTPGHHP